jgi:hypothetical protein
MAGKYFVDWSDGSFPTIRPAEDWEFDNAPEGDTLVECKREIREHWQNMIDHARTQLAQLSKLRAADVRRESEE